MINWRKKPCRGRCSRFLPTVNPHLSVRTFSSLSAYLLQPISQHSTLSANCQVQYAKCDSFVGHLLLDPSSPSNQLLVSNMGWRVATIPKADTVWLLMPSALRRRNHSSFPDVKPGKSTGEPGIILRITMDDNIDPSAIIKTDEVQMGDDIFEIDCLPCPQRLIEFGPP